MLRSLRKSASFVVSGVGVVSVLVCPVLELRVLAEQELEHFADDVGRVRADEFGVPAQVMLDFFLQADLKGCSLGLLGWCFQ